MVHLSGTDRPTLPPRAASAVDAPHDHLLVRGAAAEYADQLTRAVAQVAARFERVDRPTSGATQAELERLVAGVDLDRPVGLDDALRELDEVYLEHAVWFHDPGYAAHLNCPVALPALAAEVVASAVNTSVDTWDQSTVATLVEQRLVRWTADLVGLGPDADGVFTSGGTQSNLQALLVAREHAAHRLTGAAYEPELAAQLAVLATAETHFSIVKAARLLGLGSGAVRLVATGADGRMDPASLSRELGALARDGVHPMAVVATAGTTDRGCIDPLAEVAALTRAHGAWLHVDAAYGCGLLVSPTRRHLLDGIEHADSVTVDFHKSFFQPVASSAVLVRRGEDLRHVTFHADYLNPREAVVPNQVDKSLQTTRRFDALKLWLTLRASGAQALGELFDEVVDRAGEVHRRLRRDPDFEVLAPGSLSTVLFRFRPAGLPEAVADELNPAVRQALLEEGRVLVATTKVDGRPWLKLTLLNPQVTLADLDAVVEAVRRSARQHLAARAPEAVAV
ncbi:pyridoxal phosphate-dependent decarboxylase family protein [Nocardioides flavescens]|uniref:Aminotransferase class V-fold PLP-dependent enzyme n=1 Tax=Nocardioides flavescens TaxID=2691959 RepID=A0A6L7EWJ5_9ACTN|nr:aspartate aminotransferase family protein [Nocardioides flavescens]MXG89778.1 aminotransferase class V-fold PLP-dependent enzyme [Nocardioides flavescens]